MRTADRRATVRVPEACRTVRERLHQQDRPAVARDREDPVAELDPVVRAGRLFREPLLAR